MKRVAIYIRVSTDEQVQHGNWLEMQKDALIKYVESQSFSIEDCHIFTDEGKSWAQKEDRPALKKLLESAQRQEFDIVLVWKVDRFFRKTLYLLEWIETLEKMWVWFRSITQPFDTTQAFWKMMLQMMGVIAELERELIKERTQSGILASMRKWKWCRGRTPYGYTKNTDGFLEVNEEEAKIIRMIYTMLIKEWLSVWEIAQKLTEMGIETFSSKYKGTGTSFWRKSTLLKILHSEIYMGRLVQNKFYTKNWKRMEKPESEWLISKCPNIINEKDFSIAQKVLIENQKFARRNTRKNTTYMLWKLIECQSSWYKYAGYTSSKGTKNYKINVNKTKIANFEAIWQKWVSALKIDTIVWERMKSILQHPQILEKELSKSHDQLWDKQWEIKSKIQLLNESLSKIEDNSTWLLKLISWSDESSVNYVQSQLTHNARKTQEIKAEKIALESQFGGVENVRSKMDDFMNVVNIVKDNLDKLSYESKTQICQLLIQKVIFDGTHAEICFIVPLSPDTQKKLWENHAEKFFHSPKSYIEEQSKRFKNNFDTWLEVLNQLRTYYHHTKINKKHSSKLDECFLYYTTLIFQPFEQFHKLVHLIYYLFEGLYQQYFLNQ